MKTTFLLFCVFIIQVTLPVKAFPQVKKDNLKAIGISIPIIWNNSETIQSSLGSNNYQSGKAFSYGININHSRTIYKNVYGVIGLGYFKQVFGIKRPFDFNSPTDLLFSTESYFYDNAHLYGGIGYKLTVGKAFVINGQMTYNHYFSYSQKYIVNKEYQTWQINKKTTSIGYMINMNAGIEKNINRAISIGLDVTLPILTHWNNDEMFFKNNYYDHAQQIGRNKFSIGTIISCNYHF